jgi:hypothetical protein
MPDPYAPPASDLMSASVAKPDAQFRFMGRPIEIETRFGDVLMTNAIMGLLSPILWFAGMLLGIVMVVWWVRALDLELSAVVVVVGLIWILGMMGSMAVVSIFGAVLLSPATLLIPDSLGSQTLTFDREALTEVAGHTTKSWPWRNIRRVRVVGRLLIIRVSRFAMIVISQRNLDTRGDFLRLYDEIRSCRDAAQP